MTLRVRGARRPGTYEIPYNDPGSYLTIGRFSTLNRSGTFQPPRALLKIYLRRVKKATHYRISTGGYLFAPGGRDFVIALPGTGGLAC